MFIKGSDGIKAFLTDPKYADMVAQAHKWSYWEEITEEEYRTLTQAQKNEMRKAEIMQELADIDATASRAIREVLLVKEVEENTERLNELERRADLLREELNTL